MAQLSAKICDVAAGHGHFCPGCQALHFIPKSWSFNGDVGRPSFEPSVKITGKKKRIVDGKWEGWVIDGSGNPVDHCCHYFLRNGELQFCDDSTHELAGKTVPLPDLPDLQNYDVGDWRP